MIVYAPVPYDEARDVRPADALDENALASYLRVHLRTADKVGLDLSAGLQVSQFPGGHSNLTYLLRFGGTELVLRLPPRGLIAPKAHDITREFAWLSALHPAFPLAPEPYLMCDDESIVGSRFYVMERRRGIVVRRDEPEEIAVNRTTRLRASQAFIDALAELHSLEVRSGPLAALGKPSGFVGRQVRGWSERWARSQTSDVPEMDAMVAWLAARIPPDAARPAIVHGDYKLDNVMFDPLNIGRLTAVLDWEMCALGDPLVDIGILLAYWLPASARSDAPGIVTDRPGWFLRDEILARYSLRSGRDVSSIRFYEAFACFKIAVVVQQLYQRFVSGQSRDERFADFAPRVTQLARQAAQIAGD